MITDIIFLGTGSAMPTARRNCSSVLMKTKAGSTMLFDCGEGTQLRLMGHKHFRFNRLSHIFITHLHGDHFFGIFGLLSSLSMMGKPVQICIIGPVGIKK